MTRCSVPRTMVVLLPALALVAGHRVDAQPPPAAAPELVLRIGHPTPPRWLLHSPDGALRVTAGVDRHVRLWEARTGALRHVLSGHDESVGAAAFSPDSRRLFTVDLGGSVRLWSPETGALLGTLRGLPGPYTAVAIFPGAADGAGVRIAAARADLGIRLWGPPEKGGDPPTELAELPGHQRPVRALVFSGDGRFLASGDEQGAVRLWDGADGSLQRALRGHAMPVRALAFSRDGALLLDGSDDGDALLWDTATGQRRNRFQLGRPGDGILAVALSPDGASVAAGGVGRPGKPDHTLAVWSADGAERWSGVHALAVTALGFTPDGTALISGGRDNALQSWNVQTGAAGGAAADRAALTAVEWSADGAHLLSAGLDGRVRIWNAASGALERVLGSAGAAVQAVALSPSGERLAAGSLDGAVRIWRRHPDGAWEPVRTIPVGNPVQSLAYTPDGARLAVGVGRSLSDGAIQILNGDTGQVQRTLTGQSLAAVRGLAFSPDGASLVSASSYGLGGEVRFWDSLTGALLKKEYCRGARDTAFSRDGRTVITVGLALTEQLAVAGDEVRVWNGATRELQRTILLSAAEGGGHSTTLAPDGATAYVGSRDGTVRIVNLRLGRLAGNLEAHAGAVHALALSPDGRRLVSAGDDNTLRLWSTGGSRLLGTTVPLPATREEPDAGQWIALTPQGYYHGSGGAARRITWRLGADVFPVEAFSQGFHRPDRVRERLSDQAPEMAASPTESRFQAGHAAPPQIEFLSPQAGASLTGERTTVELSVTAESPVVEVEVLVNGRPTGARPIEIGKRPIEIGKKPIEIGKKPIEIGKKAVPVRHETEHHFQIAVPLPPGGGQVMLAARARDRDGLEGRGTLVVGRAGAPGGSGALHVLAVGVSRYQNPAYNLKYAAADATAFTELWQKRAAPLYRAVHPTRLLDQQATTAAVRAQLAQLVGATGEQDTLALFLSGHGLTVGEGDYYFATHDVDAASVARVRETGLHWTALAGVLATARARRVMLFLDACHSGNGLGGRQASTERLAEAMARQAGVVVLASSRGAEFSYELDHLQHGAFTAALLEGLGEGKADLEIAGRRDSVITTPELLAYVGGRVPQLTAERQNPTCPFLRDFGEAFPILRLN